MAENDDKAPASDVDDPDYGPNPELYDDLSEPYNNKADADEALKGFLLAVKQLREDYAIPEVLVLAATHYSPAPGEKESVSVRAVAFGHPDFRAQLGALAFNSYTLPVIERAEELRAMATAPGPRPKKKST